MNRWNPPSFDPPPAAGRSVETRSPLTQTVSDGGVAARHQAHQEAFARGLQEGLEEGRAQGMAMGRQEGYEKGHAEGVQAGFQQGYQSGSDRLLSLTQNLQQLESQLKAWPSVLEPVLVEWVYEAALRIAGKEVMDRAVFLKTVQEALLRLPMPGETLFLRVPASDWEFWTQVAGEEGELMNLSVVVDPSLQAGQAWVEINGVRLDVGAQARQALVRSALGLLPSEFSLAQS